MVENRFNTNPSLKQDILFKEQSVLRNELASLKSCQITFVTYAVTATGLLMGLAVNLAGSDKAPFPALGAFYLIPLIIILPFWWIFFDKASTITRIVGYYRILETAIIHPEYNLEYIGWENALSKFRGMMRRKELPFIVAEQKPSLLQLLVLQAVPRYWMLVYYTFASLAFLSFSTCLFSLYRSISFTELLLSIPVFVAGLITGFLTDRRARVATIICFVLLLTIAIYFGGVEHPSRISAILVLVAAFIVSLSISRNLVVVIRLTWGKYSYHYNHEYWKYVLNLEVKTMQPVQQPPAQTHNGFVRRITHVFSHSG
jgi:hypothetical protein